MIWMIFISMLFFFFFHRIKYLRPSRKNRRTIKCFRPYRFGFNEKHPRDRIKVVFTQKARIHNVVCTPLKWKLSVENLKRNHWFLMNEGRERERDRTGFSLNWRWTTLHDLTQPDGTNYSNSFCIRAGASLGNGH